MVIKKGYELIWKFGLFRVEHVMASMLNALSVQLLDENDE